MPKKTVPKSQPKPGDKDLETDATKKKKAGFGTRSQPASVRSSATKSSGKSPAKSAAAKSAAKSSAKPARRSMIGKAVEAVGSTVSSVAGSATSLFRRKPAKSH